MATTEYDTFTTLEEYLVSYPNQIGSSFVDIPSLNTSIIALSVADAILLNLSQSVSEALFIVSLSIPAKEAVDVRYKTRHNTAKPLNNDYTHTVGRLTFFPGQSQKYVRVPVIPNANAGTRTFYLDVSWSWKTANTVSRATATCSLYGVIHADNAEITADSTLLTADMDR